MEQNIQCSNALAKNRDHARDNCDVNVKGNERTTGNSGIYGLSHTISFW